MHDAPVRAVLFDFDGTLADSFDAITASAQHTRTHFGLPPLLPAEIRSRVGWGLVRLMAELIPGADPEAAVAVYRAHHAGVMLPMTRLLPGVAETLAALDTRGVPMAVCSNKMVAFTRELLATLGVANRFRAVLGPDSVGGIAKPDPAMVVEALRLLGVPAGHALYVGDMSVDIETARAAGVRVWVVPSGVQSADTLRAHGPDRLLGGMADLLPALEDARCRA